MRSGGRLGPASVCGDEQNCTIVREFRDHHNLAAVPGTPCGDGQRPLQAELRRGDPRIAHGREHKSRLTASGEGLLDSSPVLSWLRLGLALFGTADLLYITVVGNLSQFFAHLQLADEEGWNAAVAKRLLQRGVARRSTASFSEMMTTGKHTVEVSGNEYLRKVISGVKNELRNNQRLPERGGRIQRAGTLAP